MKTPRTERDANLAAIADLQRQQHAPKRKGPLGAPSGTQAGARALAEIIAGNQEIRTGLPLPSPMPVPGATAPEESDRQVFDGE